jgi:trk system potassium uptake protein TrkH
MVFFLSVLLIAIDNFDFETNFTAVAATLNNIGPGLAGVGPTHNFGLYSPFSKCVLIFDMLAGRLELFPMLLLFAPRSWKKYN